MKLPNGQWEFLSFFISWEVFIFNASEQVLGGFVFVFVSYKEGTNVKGNANDYDPLGFLKELKVI